MYVTVTEILKRWHLYNSTTSCNYKYSYTCIINDYSDANANKGQIKGQIKDSFFIFFQLAQQANLIMNNKYWEFFNIDFKKMCLRKQMP